MGSRTLPYECEHGLILDWGDFGPDPDDGSVGVDECPVCDPTGPCSNCQVCRWGAAECDGWSWEWQPDGTRRQVGERHPMCERCNHCRYRHGQ